LSVLLTENVKEAELQIEFKETLNVVPNL